MVIGGLWNDETVRLSIEVDNFDVDIQLLQKCCWRAVVVTLTFKSTRLNESSVSYTVWLRCIDGRLFSL